MKKDRIAVILGYVGTPFHGLQYQKWKRNKEKQTEDHQKEDKQSLNITNSGYNSNNESKENFQKNIEAYETDKHENQANSNSNKNLNHNFNKTNDEVNEIEFIPTIEHTLLQSFKKHGLLKESNCIPEKCHIRRACRTDKGVSAVLNIISLCAERIDYNNILNHFSESNFMKENLNLEKYIYIYKIIKVPKSFSPKFYASHRTYSYILPKSIFEENKDTQFLLEYLFKRYLGTKDFHNFTKRNTETGTKRFISSVKIIETINHWEIQISGQSFMMHQIRKMVGFIVLIMWYQIKDNLVLKTDKDGENLEKKIHPDFELKIEGVFKRVFSDVNYNIPKAPSEYLFLHHCEFKTYNERCSKNTKNKEPLFVEEEKIENIRNKVKNTILNIENKFIEWKKCIEEHFYEYDYLSVD